MPTDKSQPATQPTDRPSSDPIDLSPALSPADLSTITRASSISTSDIDDAGAMWRKYAGVELAGLWAAGPDGE